MDISLPIAIAGFAICSVVIFYAGRKLSYYGDQIAEITGIGKAWIGLILMASVTSLPEMFAGISAASITKSADLVVGDIIGSCAFNLLLISLLDAFFPKHPLLSRISQGQTLAGILGIILFGMVGTSLFLPDTYVMFGWLGLSSLLLFAVYLISVRVLFNYQNRSGHVNVSNTEKNHKAAGLQLGIVIRNYVLNALLVVVAALLLPVFVEVIASESGMGHSFAGTLLLAGSTSFPELAVSMAALRMGSLELAVGNLLGSNIFNILILSICDLFYSNGYLLKEASDIHIISVFASILMTAVAIVGMILRPEKKPYLMAYDTFIMLLIYLFTLYLLYQLSV